MSKIKKVFTGFKDHFGKKIYEGDYVKTVEQDTEDYWNPFSINPIFTKLGRIVWDCRRKEWQIMQMLYPFPNTRKDNWNKAQVEHFESYADQYIVVNPEDDAELYEEFQNFDWSPKYYLSGGRVTKYSLKAQKLKYTKPTAAQADEFYKVIDFKNLKYVDKAKNLPYICYEPKHTQADFL